MTPEFRRLTGLTDVRLEARGGNEALDKLVDVLNVLQPALAKEATRLSGTEGWTSHNAGVVFGRRLAARLSLMANQTASFITMDRLTITLTPYIDATEADLECSRLVRDLAFGQKADREASKLVTANVETEGPGAAASILAASAPFWKQVSALRPKPMRGGQSLSAESFEVLRALEAGPVSGDYRGVWVDLEAAKLVEVTNPGAGPQRRVFALTAAGRAALEDAP
jgi:hypothetical protein